MRAAVPRIEGQSLLIMPHGRIKLPQAAICVAEIVLNVGIAGVAEPGGRERVDGLVPLSGDARDVPQRAGFN